MDQWWSDLRTAARFLLRSPGFVLLSSLTLAIGVGANALVLAWYDSLVLDPLPLVPDYGRVVSFNGADADGTTGGSPRVSYADFQEWSRGTTGFDAMAAAGAMRLGVRAGGRDAARPAWGLLVTGDYFGVLRVQAREGRVLSPDDDRNAVPVAVVSDAFWRAELGAATDVIGLPLQLNGVMVQVVGVMPPRFAGHETGYAFDVWLPATLHAALTRGPDATRDRTARWLAGVARLGPDVSAEAAGAELARIATRVSEAGGDRPVTSAAVVPMREWRGGSVFVPLLTTLFVVTAIVLLLCCASVATMVLVRTLSRGHEIGIRLALGGSRWQVIRLVMLEVALLAVIGGVAGVVTANFLKPLVAAFAPPTGGPVGLDIRLGPRVLVACGGLTALSMLLSGLVPALRIGRGRLASVVAEGGRSVAAPSGRIQDALVVAQLALAVIGLVVASLFVRSLGAARRVDVGFRDPGSVLLYNLDFATAAQSREEATASMRRIVARVRALSGVAAATSSTMAPLGFGGHSLAVVRVPGYVPSRDETMSVEVVGVTGGYFELMGMPLVSGRAIDDTDRPDAIPTAVVNEAFVRRFLDMGTTEGRLLDFGSGLIRIVGVVRDARIDELREPPRPVVFRPWEQQYRASTILHLKTDGDPHLHARSVLAAVQAENPALVPGNARTLAEHMGASTFVQRLGGSLSGTLGALALAIALVGLYGVISYMVGQRERELGVRMAMGADASAIRRHVLTRAWRLGAIGLGLGLPASLALSNAAASRMTGASAFDLPTLAGVTLAVLLASGIAALVPAWRAGRISVVAALAGAR